MESKENIMVRTMIARDPIIDASRIYTKGIIIVTRSFHDKFYIVSMGMNSKVQGRLPLLQCITFHSLLDFDEVVVLEFYLAQHQLSMTHRSFRGSHRRLKHIYNP